MNEHSGLVFDVGFTLIMWTKCMCVKEFHSTHSKHVRRWWENFRIIKNEKYQQLIVDDRVIYPYVSGVWFDDWSIFRFDRQRFHQAVCRSTFSQRIASRIEQNNVRVLKISKMILKSRKSQNNGHYMWMNRLYLEADDAVGSHVWELSE